MPRAPFRRHEIAILLLLYLLSEGIHQPSRTQYFDGIASNRRRSLCHFVPISEIACMRGKRNHGGVSTRRVAGEPQKGRQSRIICVYTVALNGFRQLYHLKLRK
ncbi:hypothetical protein K432DRAFT_184617 [Lepidopterella palustris CBS 459.81]|uniref:Secreted protein n=1 Tax=Lepidopterella palustris CBS 459.81 TaxID=1314670 RepID=A0A8E2JIB0_9PEZI|nr:hypothetical protein K432DRAFT_184617 [Lepidopterella palustris CBS 459.81]